MELEDTQVQHVCQMDGCICFKETGICGPSMSIHQLTFSDTRSISLRNFSFHHSPQLRMYRRREHLLSINKIRARFLLCATF